MRIHTVAAGEGLCPKIDRLLKELVSSLFFHRTLKGCDTTLFPSTVGKDCLMPLMLEVEATPPEMLSIFCFVRLVIHFVKGKTVQKYLRRQREPMTAATAARLPQVTDD